MKILSQNKDWYFFQENATFSSDSNWLALNAWAKSLMNSYPEKRQTTQRQILVIWPLSSQIQILRNRNALLQNSIKYTKSTSLTHQSIFTCTLHSQTKALIITLNAMILNGTCMILRMKRRNFPSHLGVYKCSASSTMDVKNWLNLYLVRKLCSIQMRSLISGLTLVIWDIASCRRILD